MNNTMREAQQRWDNAQPPDTSRREREHEEASIAAFARYLKTGDLPGREDASHVWAELENHEASGIVLFDMLEAYRAGDDDWLLDAAKRVADRVESIVEDKIEEGLQWPSNT